MRVENKVRKWKNNKRKISENSCFLEINSINKTLVRWLDR